MITEAIIDAFLWIGKSILTFLPDWTLPAVLVTDMSGYATSIREWIQPVSYWVPFGLAFQVALLVMTLKVGTRVFSLIVFLRRLLLP